MINFTVLENIKNAEIDNDVSILVIDDNLSIPLEDLIGLQSFGRNITIAVNGMNEAGALIGKLNGYGYKIVLTRRIPIIKYDVLISTTFDGSTSIVAKNLKIKYICFTNFVKNFNLTNYYEFEENSYKLSDKISTGNYTPPPHHQPKQDEETEIKEEDAEYEGIVKDIVAYDVKYDKYKINYLYPQVPGKISVIMIVSTITNTFADVIRGLKAQDMPSIEFIIVDNAASFRNNVKPQIRYGEKMPKDFCEYHAKELTSGEYIFVLDETSELFDLATAITQGKYETR